MKQRLVEAIEGAGAWLAFVITVLSAIAWAAIAGTKWLFYRESLRYGYWPEASAETLPVLWTCAVFLIGIGYCTVKAAVTGQGQSAVAVSLIAPQVFAFSAVVTVLWMLSEPATTASRLPLVGLSALSAWGWYVSTWGYLSGRRRDTQKRQVSAAIAMEQAQTEETPARLSHPSHTFAGIYGNDAIKARLKDASQTIISARREGKTPRNGILLHGEPGNGKTAFAAALAGELRLPLITLAYADVASQWVGQKSTRVRAAFEQARRQQPCVLFIDEVDSFLESRDGRPDGQKEDRDLVNALLTLMVDIRAHRVILAAATNHIDRLDAAGVREGRFDFKVEITAPDLPARIGLLRRGLTDGLPKARVEEGVIEMVARRWNGFSAKRILAVTEELPAYLQASGAKQVGFEELMGALRQLQGERGHVPEDVKPLEQLVFASRTREMLQLIVGRMADPEHTERHGGTLPTGVLFFGPPGTGKTAACKALAHAVGWAFLLSTGAELARDPDRLEAVYAKAKSLRPAIIFIDEADELLRDRQYSVSTQATNKLLTLMDGVADRVRDVVWIAATNHPDQIDPALLRGGRFTEKVVFELPSAGELAGYVRGWLEHRRVVLEQGLQAEQVSAMLGPASIANAEAALQMAVNRAVARREATVQVKAEDVQRAMELLQGVPG